MLVLHRAVNEEIIIGSGERAIRIVLLDHDRTGAKIGIDAPRDIKIDRLEVRHRKETEGERCGRSGSGFGPV